MAGVPTSHAVPRFVLVGSSNLVVSLAVFYLCYHYLALPSSATGSGAQAAVANVLAYFAGMINSFLLNRSWTFRAGPGVGMQAARFVALNLASLALGTLTVFVLVDRLRYPELVVWVPLAGLIMVSNYVGMKYWAFAAPSAVRVRSGNV
jgi:putative flippase GtrA